jgi:hypothetical protein
MRNLLETSSIAQRLDGVPSDGEPAFPRIVNLAAPETLGKLPDRSIFTVSMSADANSPTRVRAASGAVLIL